MMKISKALFIHLIPFLKYFFLKAGSFLNYASHLILLFLEYISIIRQFLSIQTLVFLFLIALFQLISKIWRHLWYRRDALSLFLDHEDQYLWLFISQFIIEIRQIFYGGIFSKLHRLNTQEIFLSKYSSLLNNLCFFGIHVWI